MRLGCISQFNYLSDLFIWVLIFVILISASYSVGFKTHNGKKLGLNLICNHLYVTVRAYLKKNLYVTAPQLVTLTAVKESEI